MTLMLLLMLVGVVLIGPIALIYGTLKKNRMGINLNALSCPRCQAVLPRVRKPKNVQQAMWGGSTCPSCGAEIERSRPGSAVESSRGALHLLLCRQR